MRKRYQEGSIRKIDGMWVVQWWEDGHRRNRRVGKVSEMTKAEARSQLATILGPINIKQAGASSSVKVTFKDFVEHLYLPFFERKWKSSTADENRDRIAHHLIPTMGEQTISSFTRDELQDFLDEKAKQDYSYSVVAHLRWDLKQIFNLAVNEGYVQRNPAAMLFIPREAKRPIRKIMNLAEVNKMIASLPLMERLIVLFAISAGMRPSEIFALTWGRLEGHAADVKQGVYRGKVDTPKTFHSIRKVALPEGLMADIKKWKRICPVTSKTAWVFPSEKLTTPLSKDNCWRRRIAPKLKLVGLEWATFQVMRRTHSSMMSAINVDPKLVADQLGHTLDVNQNIYTLAGLDRRKEAVDKLESTLKIA